MKNVLRIARRQIHSILETRSTILLLVLVAALGIVSGLGARHHAVREAEARLEQQSLVERQWLEQPGRHPHRVIHYGFLLFREEAPLAFFDPGVSPWAGTALYLEGHRQNSASFGDARHATTAASFGRLTPAAVLGLLAPLLIIVAGFASVSGEREQGTLPLLLAQGATPGQIVAGKSLGIGAAAAAAALPVGLVTAAFMAFGGAEAPSWLRVGALVATYGAYLAGWVLVTVWISSRRKSSGAALAHLVALWVVLGVGAPRLAASVAAGLHPEPSRAELTAQVQAAERQVGESHNPDDPFFAALRDEYLTRYQVSSVEELPVNWRGLVSREGEAATSRIHEEHQLELLGVHQRQNRVIGWFGLLAPHLAMRDLSMSAAGTGPEAVEAFRAQAEAHRYDRIQRLNDLHIHQIHLENDRAQRLSREEWERFPEFRLEPPSLRQALADRPQALAGLGLWMLVPLLGLALGRERLSRVSEPASRKEPAA